MIGALRENPEDMAKTIQFTKIELTLISFLINLSTSPLINASTEI